MPKLSKDRRDIYYRKAKQLQLRARSAFKLLQLDEEFKILKDVKYAVDLCSAPGSWSQVLSQKLWANVPVHEKYLETRIVSVDLQEIAPIDGVHILQADITAKETAEEIIRLFQGHKSDLVCSDGAPDVTGLHDIDEYVQNQLVLSALHISKAVLNKGGTFIAKIFRGKSASLLFSQLEPYFEQVFIAKPQSSRNSSIEAFVVGLKFQFEGDKSKGREFVSCGDLSNLDSDKSYPTNEQQYLAPIHPPMNSTVKKKNT